MVVMSEAAVGVFTTASWLNPLFLKVREIWRLKVNKSGVLIMRILDMKCMNLFLLQTLEVEDFLVLVGKAKADPLTYSCFRLLFGLSYVVPLGIGLVAYVTLMITASIGTVYIKSTSESTVCIKRGFISNM